MTIEEKWKEMRSTLITIPSENPYEVVIDYPAMEKRDIDFIKEVESSAYTRGQESLKELTEMWLLRLHNEPRQWTVEQAMENLFTHLTNTKHEEEKK